VFFYQFEEFVMPKYIVALLFLFLFASVVQADDKPFSSVPRDAAMVRVLNSDYPAFDQLRLSAILHKAYDWVENSQKADSWWTEGAINEGTSKVNELSDILYKWMNLVDNCSDPVELAAMTDLGQNDYQYMTQRHNATEVEDIYNKNQNISYLDSLAYHDDFSIRNTSSLGTAFYVERQSQWLGKYDQLQIVTGGQTYNLYVEAKQTPIVFDMDGDGKLEASNGKWLPHSESFNAKEAAEKLVSFDINGDGFDEMTEWVGANDGLLLVYEADKPVTAKNLFGNEGGKYQNGFEKLSLLDADKDEKLSGDELKTLSVWQDKNGNAKVEEGEVSSIADLGVTEIGTTHKGGVSYFIHNATRKAMWDWYPVTFEKK